MKFKEIKILDKNALIEKLSEAKLTLMKENAQVAIGTIPKSPAKINTSTITKIIETIINKRVFPSTLQKSGKKLLVECCMFSFSEARSFSFSIKFLLSITL